MELLFKQAARGNYRPGRTQPVEYIVVHYTGNWSDTAKNNADYFARTVTGTSAHYFVDEEAVWQSVREEDTAWHCGSSRPVHPACRNANSIGVEMCNSAGGVPPAVRDRTAALVRELMDKYGVPAERVLRHYDVTGKRCPAPWVDRPGEWEDFKGRLEVEAVTQEQFDAMLEDYLARRGEREAIDLILRTCPDRVHTIVPGVLILCRLARLCRCQGLAVSRYGVREGYLRQRVQSRL